MNGLKQLKQDVSSVKGDTPFERMLYTGKGIK
jgi:hypothetical protein